MVKIVKNNFILILIILLSAFLNFYKLSEFPQGFHIDEVRIGYNAYSILKTSKDSHNNFLPLYYDTFGDFRPTGLIYLTIPSIAAVGLNVFAVRFPAALFGVFSVLITYFLVKKIFKKEAFALISALFFAITPWHLNLSRSTSESVISLFLIILCVYLFYNKHYIASTIFFVLTFFFYHSTRVFVPLLYLGLIVLNFNNFKEKLTRLKLIMSLIFLTFLPLLLVFGISGGTGRFRQTSLFFNPGIQQQINFQIQDEGPNKVLVARLFHNKLINYSLEFLRQYLRYFSSDFLFLEGGKPLRYATSGLGLLPLAYLPFLILGFYVCLRKRGGYLILLWWLLTGPVVAALTLDSFVPNINRSYNILPVFAILSALGFYETYLYLKNKRLQAGLILTSFLFVLGNTLYYLHQYYSHQSPYDIVEQDVALTELGKKVASLKTNRHLVIASKMVPSYEHVLFYTKTDPKEFQKVAHLRNEKQFTVGKFTFFVDYCPSAFTDIFKDKNLLFIDSSMCDLQKGIKEVDSVMDKKGNTYFKIRERI